MKILLDKSSVCGAYLFLPDEEYGEDIVYKGKPWHIPSVETCMERFQVTMLRILEDVGVKAKDVICVCDPGGACRPRTKILPEYKKKDRDAPKKFMSAREEFFEEVNVWLKSLGAIIATPKNYTEADDLINELANRFEDTVTVTRDKDMLATCSNVILINKDGHWFNPEKFPVSNKFIHVYRAVVLGDSSDNVGSVKGFGPKAWEKMIAHFGEESIKEIDKSIRNNTVNVDLTPFVAEFPPFQKMIDQEEELQTNYKVLSFLPVPAHMVKWEGGMFEGPKTLVTAENFTAVYEELQAEDFEYSVIDYEADVCDESREWSKKSEVMVDVMGQEIAGMGLRINEKNWYFSVDHCDTDNITLAQLESVLEILWGKRIYAHNVVFENTLTYNHFEALLPNAVDTALLSSYVDENDSQGLKHLSDRWLDYQQASYQDTLNGKQGMRDISGLEVLSYGIDDVITTDSLANLFETIMTYEDTLDVFHKVEDDALYFTTMAFVNGVDFDEKEFRKLKRDNDRNIEETWAKLNDRLLDMAWPGGEFQEIQNMNIVTLNKIHKAKHGVDLNKISSVKMAIRMMDDRELAKLAEDKDYALINDYYKRYWKPVAELNLRSPKQMQELLYERLGLPVRIRNKATDKMRKASEEGSPATNEAAIQNAIAFNDCDADGVELLKWLLEYKGYLTKESLFFEKWPKYVHWKTGKIHCSMRQSSTTTRRFSHSKPNESQLPKKKGREVRNMMTVPDDDWLMWALDVDSQELKLQAWASQDTNFLACYQGEVKKDVHALTGFEVAAKQGTPFDSMEDFTSKLKGEAKPFRVAGKATNFATAYLCRAKKLSQMLGVAEKEAQKFMDAKASAFPELLPAVDKYIAKCKARGYSKTFLGARRHLAGHKHFGSKKLFESESAGRLAWSFKIQGSGAEQIKLTLGSLYRSGIFDDGKVKPVTTIHDEVVGIIHKSVVEERMPTMVACLCQPYADMEIETSTTPELGSHFGRLTEWEG